MKWLLAVALAAGALAVGNAPASADELPCIPPLVQQPDAAPGNCISPEPWLGTPAEPEPVRPLPEPKRPDLRPHSVAPGSDRRPCVSAREYKSKRDDAQADIERRWEVVGLGKRLSVIALGNLVVYPRCGYSTEEAWYAVQYDRGTAYIYAEWKDPGATLHGRP